MKNQTYNIFMEYIDLCTFCSGNFNFKINQVELLQRENQCLAGWMLGLTAKQIATLLSLSHRTVESHLKSLKTKLKCQHRSEIVLLGFMHNFPIHSCFKTDTLRNE